MTIDYEIVWTENSTMNFKQFSYEMEDTPIPLNSHMPNDLWTFYAELQAKKFPTIVFVGEKERGTGIIKYCRANPA